MAEMYEMKEINEQEMEESQNIRGEEILRCRSYHIPLIGDLMVPEEKVRKAKKFGKGLAIVGGLFGGKFLFRKGKEYGQSTSKMEIDARDQTINDLNKRIEELSVPVINEAVKEVVENVSVE